MKKEKEEFILISEGEEMTDESLGAMITLGTLLWLLCAPGSVKADDVKRELKKVDKTELNASAIIDAANKANSTTYGGYSAINATNILSRTIFMEARSEGKEGMDAVASVIYNRAGGNKEKFVEVCFKKAQFSCWNGVSDDKKSAISYKIIIPKSTTVKGKDRDAWIYCQQLAGKLLSGKFTTTIGNRNSYYNPSKVTPSWSSSLSSTKTIGHHKFGYLSEWDGFKTKGATKTNTTVANSKKPAPQRVNTKVYVVKKGDQLGKIAVAHNTSIPKLIELNPKLKKNPDHLNIGDKINIPS